jgi:hypothetical protein
MPLTAKGKKLKKKFEKQYGKKKGQSVFYAMENSGKLKKVVKARGGMDASQSDFGGGSTSSGSGQGRDRDFQQRGMSKADYAKSKQTQNFGGRQSKIGPVVKDVPFKKPLSGTQSFMLGLAIPGLGTAINFGAKQQYKSRQKFAKKEGLYKDVYKTTGKVLQPNSPTGKDYLKSAGFGKSKVAPFVGNDSDPIIPISTTTKPVDPNLVKPKDNFFNFVAYKVGGLSGGVSYGPPPKRGPNSQVPPVKMKKGGYKK